MPLPKAMVDVLGDRIVLKMPYHPDAPAECKRVPGARWSKEMKAWTYPLSMTTCRKLREVFGERLDIMENLYTWARHQKAIEERVHYLGTQDDADLQWIDSVAPRLSDALATRTYQRAGAKMVSEARRVAVLDEPGLGKTALALAAVVEAGLWKPGTLHLVIAPKTAATSTWPQEIEKWTDGAHVYSMPEGTKKRQLVLHEAISAWEAGVTTGPIFVIVNAEMLRVKMEKYCKKCDMWEHDLNEYNQVGMYGPSHWQEGHKEKLETLNQNFPELAMVEWDSVIADECHRYMLNIRPGKQTAQWAEGLMRLKVKEHGLRIPMTGTPFRGKEKNVFGILHWMNSKEWGSYWRFVDLFLEKTDNGFGIDVGELRDDAKEAFDLALRPCTLRRTRKEVRGDLPEQVFIDHWVPLAGKHKSQYETYMVDGEVNLGSAVTEGIGVLEELTRLKQFSFGTWEIDPKGRMVPTGDSPKIELLLDMLNERGIDKDAHNRADPLMKVTVASQYKQIIDCVERKLNEAGIATLKITGDVTGARRAAATKEFQSPYGPCVMLLTTTAGGESISLDARCDEMIILDETFVEDEQVQLRGRIDNRGDRVATRFYHYIRTKGTIEEAIAEKNAAQFNMQAALLDGRRGVELAQRLIKGLS